MSVHDAPQPHRVRRELLRAEVIFASGVVFGTAGVAAVIYGYDQPLDVATVIVSVLCITGYIFVRASSHILAMMVSPTSEEANKPTPRALLPVFITLTLTIALLCGVAIVLISSSIYLMLGLTWAVSATFVWAFWLVTAAFAAFMAGVLWIVGVITYRKRHVVYVEIRRIVTEVEAAFRSRMAHQ